MRKNKSKSVKNTLKDLIPGESAIVTALDMTGSIKRRMIDMGITPGVKIDIIKEAPLGDPIEIRLRGYELAIRKSDAQNIKIMLKEKG